MIAISSTVPIKSLLSDEAAAWTEASPPRVEVGRMNLPPEEDDAMMVYFSQSRRTKIRVGQRVPKVDLVITNTILSSRVLLLICWN